MVKANDKLSILSSEAPINSPLLTDGGAFYQLQEEFRSTFEYTIIDLPREMLIAYPHLMADVNVTIVLAELTLASARDTIRLLSWLKTNASRSKIILVANKVQPNSLEISRQDFESSVERKIDVLIPADAKGMAQAAKLGKPYSDVNKGSKTCAKIVSIADHILGTADAMEAGEDIAEAKPASGSLLEKLGLFSGGKKKDKKPVKTGE
jgi:pilus assembly protein CpaE